MSGRRQNGFGTLLSKGKGKPFLAKWMHRGKVYYKSTGETDKKKALKALERITRPFREEREEDVWRSLHNRVISLHETRTIDKLKTEDIWNEFKKTLQNSDSTSGTIANYERGVEFLVEWMKPRAENAEDIDEKLASEYLEHLSSSIGASMWNLRLSLFKRVWKALSKEFGLNAGLWGNFKKKKTMKKSRRRTMTEKEIQTVLSKAKSRDMQLLITVGVYTGLRISDCALLKWSEVDFENGVLRVLPVKTKKHMDAPLEIPIHPALKTMLESMPKTSEFVSEHNAKKYKSKHLSDAVVELFHECGIETSTTDENGKRVIVCGFHSLRHTFISNAINNGMSALLVRSIVGHSAVNMTEAYYHDNMDKMKEGIENLPDVT